MERAHRSPTHTCLGGISRHSRLLRTAVVVLATLLFWGTLGCPSSARIPRQKPSVHRVWSATDSHPAVDQKPADSRWAGPSPANEWLPPGGLEDRSRWRGIIIHHSATDNGNAEYFNQMHKKRGWRGLGYHFVINNGHGGLDGSVEVGWRWRSQEEGAHCHPESAPDNWYNEHTIGIGLVGDFEKAPPSPAQMASLVQLVRFLQDRYAIGSDKIIGHRDAKGAKTKCPGRLFPFAELRRELR